MLLEITSLSLFLNTIQILIDGIVFNDRFEYVYLEKVVSSIAEGTTFFMHKVL